MKLFNSLKAATVAGSLAFGLLTAAAVIPATPAIAQDQVKAESQKESQKFFFMLRKGPLDTSESFMALGVAKMLAAKGNDITIFLNLDAVRLADSRQPLTLKAGMRDGTLEDTWNAAVKAGVKFIACPMCSKNAGITKENLRKGVIFGNAKIVSGAMLAADKIVNY